MGSSAQSPGVLRRQVGCQQVAVCLCLCLSLSPSVSVCLCFCLWKAFSQRAQPHAPRETACVPMSLRSNPRQTSGASNVAEICNQGRGQVGNKVRAHCSTISTKFPLRIHPPRTQLLVNITIFIQTVVVECDTYDSMSALLLTPLCTRSDVNDRFNEIKVLLCVGYRRPLTRHRPRLLGSFKATNPRSSDLHRKA